MNSRHEDVRATDLGVIIKSASLISYKIVRNSKRYGRDLLCWTTTAESGGYFSAMDLATGEVISHPLNHLEAYPIIVGSDAMIYVGSTSGEVMRWDPSVDTWGPLGKAIFHVPGRWVNHVRVMCEGPGGWLYVGSCTGERARIHMESGEIQSLPETPEQGNWYVASIARLPGNRIAFGYGHVARIFIYDIDQGCDVGQWMPPGWVDDGFCAALIAGDNVLYALHSTSGRRGVFDIRSGDLLGEVPWPRLKVGDPWSIWSHRSDSGGIVDFYLLPGTDTVIASDGQHVHCYNPLQPSGTRAVPAQDFAPPERLATEMRYDMTTGCSMLEYNPQRSQVIKAVQPTQPEVGRDLYGMGVGPDGQIYGGAYQSTLLYRCDPETEEVEILGDHHPGWAGQTYSFAHIGSEIFCASYINGAVVAYDPAKAWDCERRRMINPRLVGFLGQLVYRPFSTIAASDGRIWSVGPAGWGTVGGGIAFIDPFTGETESSQLPAESWDLLELPELRLLACGEEHIRWWGCTSNRQVGEIQSPVPVIAAVQLEPGITSKVAVASEYEILLVDAGSPGELEIFGRLASPIRIFRLIFYKGKLLAAGPDGIATVDIQTGEFTRFCDTPATQRFGVAAAAGKVFFHNEKNLMVARIPE